MKTEELLKTMLDLGLCFSGEYRGSQIERVEWVDKVDGKAKGFVKAMHLFEFGVGGSVKSIRIEQPLPKTIEDPKQVEVTLQRGKRYLLQLLNLDKNRDNIWGRLNPEFEPVEVG
ncbi:hypothetical protein OAM04_00075 [bacterium]|nr:hypothetical protein [Verrucomicrobiales bacterium]MDC0311599.1 hypothetical protein [bacterium]MDC0322488.1 hypothetical protein [Verrucomicrobiales bacterium]